MLMLLVPGLIALRIHWRGKEITARDIKYLICDYLIYSFLIMIFNYAVMFLPVPDRSVSFSAQFFQAISNIYQASFVVKYSLTSLALSIILPYIWTMVKGRKSKR